jgi:hypothetical protein
MGLFDQFGGFSWKTVERLIEPAGSTSLGVALPFAYLRVPGNRAEQAVALLLKQKPEITPIIIGDGDKTRQLADFFEGDLDPGTPEAIIAKADVFDLDAWFDERKAEYAGYASEDGEDMPPRDDWPLQPQTQNGLTAMRDVLTHEFYKSVAIALLPTAGAHYQAAAHLKVGGWNEMPDAVVQTALHKRWAEKWSARPVTMALDTIEFAVDRPVKTRPDALALGMEHFLACNDIIDQGFGNLDALAASLIGARNWYLWWD